MSWRETLNSLDAGSYTHNSHNTQNGGGVANSAYCAHSALGASGNTDTIERVCRGLPLAPSDFRRRLSPEDLEEVEAGRVSAGELRAWAELVAVNLQVEGGRVPAHWTAATTCRGCGPVPIWPGAPASVDGCPWCAVRAAGRPIPRPTDGRAA